jgi:hypothetical protein
VPAKKVSSFEESSPAESDRESSTLSSHKPKSPRKFLTKSRSPARYHTQSAMTAGVQDAPVVDTAPLPAGKVSEGIYNKLQTQKHVEAAVPAARKEPENGQDLHNDDDDNNGIQAHKHDSSDIEERTPDPKDLSNLRELLGAWEKCKGKPKEKQPQYVQAFQKHVILSDEEVSKQFGTRYDLPKEDCCVGPAYMDDDSLMAHPLRKLHVWSLKNPTTGEQLPLPTSHKFTTGKYKGAVLSGMLIPCTLSHEKREEFLHPPIRVSIQDLECITFDRTRMHRGYWVKQKEPASSGRKRKVTPKTSSLSPKTAFYFLSEPLSPDIHLDSRGEIALMSNLLDICFREHDDLSRAHASMEVAQLHLKILSQVGQSPFDIVLLKRYRHHVLLHLSGWCDLSLQNDFFSSLAKLSARPIISDTAELSHYIREAEKRSHILPWGCSKPDLPVNKIRFNLENEQFQALLGRDHGGVGTDLPLEQATESCPLNYLEKLVKLSKSKQNKYQEMPVSSASQFTRPVTNICASAPKSRYNQDSLPLCLPAALASALSFLGLNDSSQYVWDHRAELSRGSLHVAREWLRLHLLRHLGIRQWQIRSLGRSGIERVLSQQESSRSSIFLVGLARSDGQENHAVAICNNWLFDGNFETALPLSQEALNHCCYPSECEYFFDGLELFQRQEFSTVLALERPKGLTCEKRPRGNQDLPSLKRTDEPNEEEITKLLSVVPKDSFDIECMLIVGQIWSSKTKMLDPAIVSPKIVLLLQQGNMPEYQFVVARTLAHLVSKEKTFTDVAVKEGAIEFFVQLLSNHRNQNLAKLAVFALGNIAAVSTRYANLILSAGAIEPVLSLIKMSSSVSLVPLRRMAMWALSNFCRHVEKQHSNHLVSTAVTTLAEIVMTDTDDEVITSACYAFSFLSFRHDVGLASVFESGVIPRLVDLLFHR